MIRLKKFDIRLTHILLLTLVFLVLLLISQFFLRKDYILQAMEEIGIKDQIAALLSPNILKTKSSVDIFIQDNKLKIKFNLTDQGKTQLNKLSQKLTTTNVWLDGISVGLDEKSLNFLQSYLPTHLDLDLDDNKLFFKSASENLMASSLSTDHFKLASGSANLDFQGNSSNFVLQISSPAQVLSLASSSGKLHLSSNLTSLVPILEKMAAIKLSVKGKNIEGEIKLK